MANYFDDFDTTIQSDEFYQGMLEYENLYPLQYDPELDYLERMGQ